MSFCRIDDQPITIHEPIGEPDALVVQDPTLLHQVPILDGLASAYVLVNTSRPVDLGIRDLRTAVTRAGRHGSGHRSGPRAPRPATAQHGTPRAGSRPSRTSCHSTPVRRHPRTASPARWRGTSRPHARIRRRERSRRSGSPCLADRRLAGRGRDGRALPPRSHRRVPDLAADPHRRGALGPGAAGDLGPCEYLMVESEFAAMSACIGASAVGRTHLHGHRQPGPALHGRGAFNASGLGLPVVMTVANRAIGAPINIWNDHSDSMSMRDSGGSSSSPIQPGGGRPARAGVRARRAALASRHGLHGRLRADPCRRADRRAHPGAGRRVPARRSCRDRCSTQTTRSRSARWSAQRHSPR